jgi:hypothetical protein
MRHRILILELLAIAPGIGASYCPARETTPGRRRSSRSPIGPPRRIVGGSRCLGVLVRWTAKLPRSPLGFLRAVVEPRLRLELCGEVEKVACDVIEAASRGGGGGLGARSELGGAGARTPCGAPPGVQPRGH